MVVAKFFLFESFLSKATVNTFCNTHSFTIKFILVNWKKYEFQ